MLMSSKSAVALSSLLLILGYPDGKQPMPQPKQPGPKAAAENLRRPARLQISVFEVDVGEPGKFIESADRLRGIETDTDFEKALGEFGTPHRFTTIDRMADLSEELTLVLGSTLPIVQGRNGPPNNNVNIQYRDVGSTLYIRPGPIDPDQHCLYAAVDLELSSGVSSQIKLGDDVFAPIYSKYKSKSVMRLEFGKPDVTIDFVSHSKDETPRAVVIRYLVTELK